MTRFALIIEYDGTPFNGFQRQDNAPSVQQAIEDAVFRITGETTQVISAGRTDSGVHALAMHAHVDIERDLTPFRLMEALNAQLRPDPIAVLACGEVDADWHARFACTGRRYLYRIANRRAPLTVLRRQVWQVPPRLDVEAMHEAAQLLTGRHDFTTFRSVACQAKDPVKTLDRLDVERVETSLGEEIHVHAAARSFLHHQVRSMVGCLKLVGTGTWNADRLAAALAARNRAKMGLNAPAHGLYFVEALYPETSKDLP